MIEGDAVEFDFGLDFSGHAGLYLPENHIGMNTTLFRREDDRYFIKFIEQMGRTQTLPRKVFTRVTRQGQAQQ